MQGTHVNLSEKKLEPPSDLDLLSVHAMLHHLQAEQGSNPMSTSEEGGENAPAAPSASSEPTAVDADGKAEDTPSREEDPATPGSTGSTTGAQKASKPQRPAASDGKPRTMGTDANGQVPTGAEGGAGGEEELDPGLMAAVHEGDEDMVGRMLGERRAEVDMIDSGGATPLMLACHQGNPQLGEMLNRAHT